MEKLTLITTETDAGTRLDAYLAANLEATTRSGAGKLIESGQVSVGGKVPAKNYKLRSSRCCDWTPIARVARITCAWAWLSGSTAFTAFS